MPDDEVENPRRQSWTTRSRERMEREAFDGQTIGPNGATLHSRQVHYEWRQQRAQISRAKKRLLRAIRNADPRPA